jgi:predicted phosphodiesterase
VVVAVISDTHLPRGSRSIPDACVASMRASDLILHAGDFTSERVLNALQELGPPVAAVCGNADEEALRRALPEVREVDAAAVVFGHSHIPLQEERDGFQIFNPGSPTDKRRQPRFTMGIGEVDGGRIRFRHVPLD